MNDIARQKLCEIIARYGRDITLDARRCEGLMRDNFPTHRREIAVLSTALEERIPSELLNSNSQHTPRNVTFARLAARLQSDVAMEGAAARWAIHTWALALGVITDEQLAALEAASEASASPTTINQDTTSSARTVSGADKTAASLAATRAPATSISGANASPLSPTPRVKQPASTTQSPNVSPTSTLIVTLDGSGDFSSISDALLHAPPNSRVLVRPGIYVESLVLDKQIEIVGDGALDEIIVQATAASCLTMLAAGEAVVRNLTLQGLAHSTGHEGFFAVDIAHGRLRLEGCDVTSDSLACIAIHNREAAPVIHRCRIHHGFDSGIYCFDEAGGSIEACDIFANANINLAINGAHTNVAACRIHHGANAGLVIWNKASNTIEDCDIYANALSGIGISDEATTHIRRSRLHEGGNTGVYVHRSAQATLEECDIYAHREAEVAVATGGDARLRGCRLHHSQASGIIISDTARAMLEACECFDNADSGAHLDAGGVLVARASRFNRNGHVGIAVETGGAVDVESCDLSGNRIAAWQSDYGSRVESRHNRL